MTKDCHNYVILTVGAFICFVILFAGDAYLKYQTSSIDQHIVNYENLRQNVLDYESAMQFGSKLQLTLPEIVVNQRLMEYKAADIKMIFENITAFTYERDELAVQMDLQNRPLFQMLRSMPKGGALNIHDITMCDIDLIIYTLSYHKNLWLCVDDETDNYVAARFSFDEPQIFTPVDCKWTLANTLRNLTGFRRVDEKLRRRLTLDKQGSFDCRDEAIDALNDIHHFIYGMITYKSAWMKCYWQAMQTYLNDGVQYLEIRTSLPELYTLSDEKYSKSDNLYMLNVLTNSFKVIHPTFANVKIIYAQNTYNSVDQYNLSDYIKTAKIIVSNFNAIITGFDIINQDEEFYLQNHAKELLSLEPDENFYLHAGETNFLNSETDLNLMDAILLGVKRIGSGFTLLKHPELLRTIKSQNIPIEVNPVDRRVPLNLNNYRNHPDALLFATGFPILISADDPIPMTNSDTPMTLDFYIAFVAISQKTADLTTLKMLAINSIRHSGMTCVEKTSAFERWARDWDNWITKMQALNKTKMIEKNLD